MFVGGVGGTLYHGLRVWHGFFLMDVLPIYLLGAIVSVYWWVRLGPRVRHLLAMMVVLGLIQLFGIWQLPPAWKIQLSYALLATLILIPLALVMIRTRARHWPWVATSFVSFGIAWFFRIADTWRAAGAADGHALALAHVRGGDDVRPGRVRVFDRGGEPEAGGANHGGRRADRVTGPHTIKGQRVRLGAPKGTRTSGVGESCHTANHPISPRIGSP